MGLQELRAMGFTAFEGSFQGSYPEFFPKASSKYYGPLARTWGVRAGRSFGSLQKHLSMRHARHQHDIESDR